MTDRTEPMQCTRKGIQGSPADLLAGFAEAIPLPVVLVTPDTRIRHANTAWVRALGVSSEHYLHGKFPSRWLMHPRDNLAQFQELLHTASQAETDPEPIHLSLRASDGAEIPTKVHARPLPGLDNCLSGLLIVTLESIDQDVSQLRDTQEELRHSEERLKIIYECAPDAYYLCDLKGRFVDGNRAAEKLVGYKREELLGKSLLELNLLPKKQIPRAASALIKNAVGRPTGPDEFTLNRGDGTQGTVEVSTYPVKIQGKVLVLGIARDVTARKQAEEAILREKAFSDSVINSLPGVFYMFDEEGKYVWWNRNLEEVCDYSTEEIVQLHPIELFPNTDQKKVNEAIAQAFDKGKTVVEADLLSKSGRKTPYYFTGLRVEKNGKPYLIGLGIDITERRKAQVMLEKLNEDLEASVRELERSNRELADFAHVTAHDLKAPLRGIITLADWLAQDYAEQIDEQGQENLNLLRERVDRMTRLIDGILRYSEIGHGDQDIEILDTHVLVEEVIEQIAPPEHIEIRIEGELPRVRGERTRLTQVFQNLISNAVKYIDKPQGRITVSAHGQGEAWEFAVADNGPGIEAKHFSRIFQMFQTLSIPDRCDSTGLGLAVVKKIVDMYGGRIWLESEIGVGSIFHFTLPRDRQTDAPGAD